MSTKVVPVAASRAKRPANGNQPKKQAEQQPAVNEDEARLAQVDSEKEADSALANKAEADSVQSETSSTPEFTFGAALAEAAASSSLLAVEAERADNAGFGQFGDGEGSTILLIGAIALVALGVVVLVSDGGNKNEAPTITAAAAATTAEDTAVTLTAPTTADPDGDALTVTATATNGTVVKNANGSFTFTPNANFNGTGVVTYTVSDGELSATATQNVTVTAVDDPAVAGAAVNLAVTEDTPATGTASITDPDGPAITYAVGTQGTKGTAAVTAAGAVTYTPNLNATGADTFTITGGGVSQTFNVTIAPVNDAPNLGPDETFNLSQGQIISGTLTATDVDGPTPLVFGITTQPAHGTLTVTAAGALTYTPTAGYSGADSFVVNVADGATPALTDTRTINVTITAAPPATVIDNATGVLQVSASGGDIDFTDNVTVRTNVEITGFGAGDEILVDHPSDNAFNARNSYFYTTNNVAGGAADDLIISFNASGNFTQIVLVDAAINADGGLNLVFDYASAKASLGFDFITIA